MNATGVPRRQDGRPGTRRGPTADGEVLDLSVGQISGPGPEQLQDVLAHGLAPPFNSYTAPRGLPGARAATARALGLEAGPEGVMMTTGASGAFLAFLLVCRGTRPQPRIALPDPCYPAFLNTCRRLGVAVDTYPLTGPRIDLGSFAAAITDQTIGAVVISPGNPTGVVTCPPDVLAAERAAAAGDVPLVLDESYADLIDPAVPQARPMMLHERSVRLRSFSKGFALSGHRTGALVAAPSAVDAFAQAHFAALMSAPTLAQVLAATCLDPVVSEPFLARTRERLSTRHAALREALVTVPGVEVDAADVGVFAWVRGPLGTARRLAADGVLVVPGAAFGVSSPDRFRVLADVPAAAVDRLTQALRRAVAEGADR